MSREARAQEQVIKDKIVDGYKRGVCDHNGCHIPPEKRGMAGKGSRFIAKPTDKKAYDRNYKAIFGHD
jgi:hypothetical protein